MHYAVLDEVLLGVNTNMVVEHQAVAAAPAWSAAASAVPSLSKQVTACVKLRTASKQNYVCCTKHLAGYQYLQTLSVLLTFVNS
jgi:hypothetical protein